MSRYFLFLFSLLYSMQILAQPMDYDLLKIKSYKYWDVYLHENQCYLGRVFVQLKESLNIEDF